MPRKRAPTPIADLDNQAFLKFDSVSESEEDPPLPWDALAGWEILFTPLGRSMLYS